MTCMNEAHLAKYDRNCNPCQNELREYVKNGIITKEQYNSWILGKEEIINPMYNKSFVKSQCLFCGKPRDQHIEENLDSETGGIFCPEGEKVFGRKIHGSFVQ